MALTKEQKTEEIAEVTALLEDAGTVYLTDYMGLDVERVNELRARFYESEVKYRVVKNTLLRKALENFDAYEGLYEYLKGPTAVAFSSDPSTAARVIKRFKVDTSSEMPVVKAAYVEGAIYAGDQIDVLASLKSKDELLGDIAGLLLSPMANVVGALQAPGGAIAAIVEALQDRDDES